MVIIAWFTILSFMYPFFGNRTYWEEGWQDAAHEYSHAGEPNNILCAWHHADHLRIALKDHLPPLPTSSAEL